MVNFDGGCRLFGLREGEPTRRGGLSIWRHVGRERGAAAISFSALELAPEASSAWRNADCDEVLFVLSGRGEILLETERHPLSPEVAVYVRPLATVGIENRGDRALTLLSSRCPDPGPEISFETALASVSSGASASGSRPSPVVHLEDRPIEQAGDGRWFRVLVDAKTGSEQVTQFVGFIPPGRAPEHFHEYEEIVCILEGEGRFWSGTSSAPIAPDTCIYLPRRQTHCLENTSDVPVKLFGLFYPAGSPAVRHHPGGAAS